MTELSTAFYCPNNVCTKAQAEEDERKVLERIRSGTYRQNPYEEKTVEVFVRDTFIPWAKESKRSWRNDVSRAKPIVSFFGKYRLIEVSPFLVESYKARRHKTPVVFSDKNGETWERPRSVAAVNRELQLLSRIFTLAGMTSPVGSGKSGSGKVGLLRVRSAASATCPPRSGNVWMQYYVCPAMSQLVSLFS